MNKSQTRGPLVATVKNGNYLNPGHIMLLHFFHLLLNRRVQFVFKLERLHVIHIPIAVEQISLKCSSWPLLRISGCLGLLLIIAIAVIPVSNTYTVSHQRKSGWRIRYVISLKHSQWNKIKLLYSISIIMHVVGSGFVVWSSKGDMPIKTSSKGSHMLKAVQGLIWSSVFSQPVSYCGLLMRYSKSIISAVQW
jgi:hypothetical protein